MRQRSDRSPSTLPVEVDEEAVAVEYLDGRRARYRADRQPVETSLRCRPGKDVHVLVTDPSTTEGVVVYVNDRSTHDDVLDSTGVGRVLLGSGEETELFPGVRVRMEGYAVEVEADPSTVNGRVFVFEEDEMGERAYEIVGT